MRFETFWASWPKRNGKRLGRAETERGWRRLSSAEQEAALVGARHYAAASAVGAAGAMDAHRWLAHRWWVDWQEPVVVDAPRRVGGATRENTTSNALALLREAR